MATKKRRTREHVIADMSVHHLGYLIVRCGFTFDVIKADYGYDGYIFTYDSQGEIENSNIFVQLKVTDAVKLSKDQKRVLFRPNFAEGYLPYKSSRQKPESHQAFNPLRVMTTFPGLNAEVFRNCGVALAAQPAFPRWAKFGLDSLKRT